MCLFGPACAAQILALGNIFPVYYAELQKYPGHPYGKSKAKTGLGTGTLLHRPLTRSLHFHTRSPKTPNPLSVSIKAESVTATPTKNMQVARLSKPVLREGVSQRLICPWLTEAEGESAYCP